MADSAYYSRYFTVKGANYSQVPQIQVHQYLENGTEENVNVPIYYRYNTNTQLFPGAWQSWTRGSSRYLTLTVPSNIDYVEFKSDKAVWGNTTRHLEFSFGGDVDLSGNIMSLCWGDNFYGAKTFRTEQANGIFYKLFVNASIKSAENLVLPVTHYENVIPTYCYYKMFASSTVINGPQIDLRSTDDGYFCCNMFLNCSNLVDFTTNLQGGTNNYQGCVAGTKSGTVYNYSGTNIRNQLYYRSDPTMMYKNAPILGTAYLGYDRVLEIHKDNKQIVTLKKNNTAFYSVTENEKGKYLRIFNNTSYTQTIKFAKSTSSAPTITIKYLNNADVLTTLGTTSVEGLTYSLSPGTSLYITSTASTWASSTTNYNYISGCTYIDGNIHALTNFVVSNSNYKFCNLFSNCSTLVHAGNISLNAGTGNYACYHMFYGLTNLKFPPIISCSAVGNYSFDSCFAGCTSITSIKLIFESCGTKAFTEMFNGCTLLNKIEYGAYSNTHILSDTFENWVYGVAATGNFYRCITEKPPTGVNGIPEGWNDVVSPIIITRQ